MGRIDPIDRYVMLLGSDPTVPQGLHVPLGSDPIVPQGLGSAVETSNVSHSEHVIAN